jgi:hypothetical protein
MERKTSKSPEGAIEILPSQIILSPLRGSSLLSTLSGGLQKALTTGYCLIAAPRLCFATFAPSKDE